MSIDSKSRAVGWMIAGLALASMAVHAAGPVARWTFEVGEGAVALKKGAWVLTFGAHGKCLRLADGSSRAVARTDAKTPDIADAAKPYAVMLWLKPDGGLVGDGLGQVGPKAGVGAFWHLTDNWSLRADADATLGLDSCVAMLYSLSIGVQYAF